MNYDEQDVPLLPGPNDRQQKQPQKRSKLLTVCPFILGNEFCERLAYYGLATNFVTYLTHIMGVDAATAAIEVMVFEGTCYVTPLLGAYLADSHWGRYKTILVFSSIYLVGMVCLALTSWLPGLTPGPYDDPSLLQNALLFGSLGVIALGTGGIKPNVSAFGADQFDEKDPQDKREKERFFNWFYLAINVGSLIACTAVVYVQDAISWSLGFALPAAAMASAVLLFLAGSANYRHVAPTESPMARVVKVVAAALKNRWRSKRGPEDSSQHKVLAPGSSDEADGSLHRALYYQHMYGSDAPAAAAAAANTLGGSSSRRNGDSYVARRRGSSGGGSTAASSSYRWLEDAITEWQTSQGHMVVAEAVGGGGGSSAGHGGQSGVHLGGYTPQQVEEVKLVLRLLPVFFTTVLYWTIYAMMGTMFIQQGSLMDNRVSLPGTNVTLRIPAATMALFNTGAIILLVPLYDAVFEPALKRCGVRWTLLRRIGWGMVIAVLAMVYAAAVEAWRLDIFRAMPDSGDSSDPAAVGYGPAVVPLSIMWQAPAYVLIGASEVLASIAQLEFFYDQAPDVMRSCSMALQLLSTAVGSYLGGGLVAAVAALSVAAGAPWLPKDLNLGHLDWFLLLCGGLMAANSLLFVLVANNYEYKTVEHVVLVQVADDEEAPDALGRPPLPRPPVPRPPTRPQGSAIAINSSAARRSQYHYAAVGNDDDSALYGRSLAFVPTSPALPAPFR
uniref:Major facilitator superfamily (MFS) profile domain-containing protein n=1 Tax=Tetradesmus obliquus TaxID=3088 RepID=A0A383WJ92_TETOB|eukprot:jgi/Sobl393_1/1276/SZX77184.1